MTPERWQRIKDVLHEALSRPPEQRVWAVTDACGEDLSLRREVAELLDCDGSLGTFLDHPLLAADAPAVAREIPDELRTWDRFEILDRVGSGGMATVYKAWDPRLQRSIAVKIIAGGDDLTVRRFLREAEAQARVEHENVLEVYETGVVGHFHYIAMQYIDGPTLTGMREETTLEEKLELLIRVAEGLHAAHRTGLIHRDIKPGNILVERNADAPKPYLLDFGLAVEPGEPGLTATGVVIGTPRYMAPERISASHIALDRRSDIYSLGATFYELLSGQPPFSSSSALQTLVEVVESDVRPLRSVLPGVPPEVDAIVMKCLEKDPERRYATARAVAEDVRRYLDGEPVQARATGTATRLARKARKYPRLTAAFAVLLAAALGVGAWAALTSWRAGRQTDLARRLEQEVRDVEWLFRAAQMSPLHPIAPQKKEVRRRMAQIERLMGELGPFADGPGLYALGRGHLTLRDNVRALEHLRRAWESGYRTSGAAVALGLAHGEIYRQELTRAGRIADQRQRENRIAELKRTHAASARSYLERGRASSIMPARYVDAVIAAVSGQVTTAVENAESAVDDSPWLHEARVLQGAVQFQQAYTLYLEHDPRALETARLADRAYARAAEIAPSSADAYAGRCAVAGLLLHMGAHRIPVDVSAAHAAAQESCARAVLVEPDRAEAWRLYAEALTFWANARVSGGENPGDAYDRAGELARRAAELSGNDLQSTITSAQVELDRAWWQSRNGADPRPAIERVIDSYTKAMRLDPRDDALVTNVGLALVLRARYEIRNGMDAVPSVDRAIEAFQRALRLNPQQAFAFSNLAKASVERAKLHARAGRDPQPPLDEVERFVEGLPGDASFPPRVKCLETIRARS